MDTSTSYIFDEWKFNPEIPEDQKIVEDTKITANIKDRIGPKAYSNGDTLTFYHDEQTHEGTSIDVPLAWGSEEYSDNWSEERQKSPFASFAETTTNVVFDTSFYDVKGLCSMCC